MNHLQHWPHLGKDPPPLPVANEEMLANIALDDSNGQPLVKELLVMLSHEVPSAVGLELANDLAQSFVSHVLEMSEHASLEEHLAASHAVLALIQLEFINDEPSGFAAVHKTRWYSLRSKDGVSV